MNMKSLLKKALILCVCLFFTTLLPMPSLNIPGFTAIAEASDGNSEDNTTDAKLNVKSLSLVKDDSYTLRVYNTADSTRVSFRSSDTDVVTILEGNGNTATVTGLKVGTATVTVTLRDGRKTSTLDCEITVGPPMISYKFIQVLEVGRLRTLGAIVRPSNTTEVPVFTSSDRSVATVNSSGRVFTRSPGTTVITATLSNGKTATCTIIVTE